MESSIQAIPRRRRPSTQHTPPARAARSRLHDAAEPGHHGLDARRPGRLLRRLRADGRVLCRARAAPTSSSPAGSRPTAGPALSRGAKLTNAEEAAQHRVITGAVPGRRPDRHADPPLRPLCLSPPTSSRQPDPGADQPVPAARTLRCRYRGERSTTMSGARGSLRRGLTASGSWAPRLLRQQSSSRARDQQTDRPVGRVLREPACGCPSKSSGASGTPSAPTSSSSIGSPCSISSRVARPSRTSSPSPGDPGGRRDHAQHRHRLARGAHPDHRHGRAAGRLRVGRPSSWARSASRS